MDEPTQLNSSEVSRSMRRAINFSNYSILSLGTKEKLRNFPRYFFLYGKRSRGTISISVPWNCCDYSAEDSLDCWFLNDNTFDRIALVAVFRLKPNGCGIEEVL